MAPVILDAARELAKDPKVLDQANLERTTASYKMRFGLAKTFHDEIINDLISTPFSLNIDESTSNSDKPVLAILVSYFCSSKQSVVVQHLTSLEVTRVTADALFEELNGYFELYGIPWENVVSILMDSCSVMRGSKNGLETKIRQNKAPQLLDIDGDSCHHIDNAWKQFCKPFDNWVEHLQSDIHNDIKWSADLKEFLQEICLICSVKFTMPVRFVNHRWLSAYDACNSNSHMTEVLKVFYYPFLCGDNQSLFKEPTLQILVNMGVSQEGINRIKEIWKSLGKKSLTEDGKKRKARIAEKLIIHHKKTELIVNFYSSVLLLLKEYVCLFQSSEPLIHILHDKQEQVFKDFLSCFVKSENLTDKSAKHMKNINLDDIDILLQCKDLFLGKKVRDIINLSHKKDSIISEFF